MGLQSEPTPSNLTETQECNYKALEQFLVISTPRRTLIPMGEDRFFERTEWDEWMIFRLVIEYWDEDTIGVRIDWD